MTEGQFALLPIEVVLDKRLTLEQTRVLIALFSFRNKVTDTVWPSRAAIAERTGMHPSNISAATTALVGLGWLKKAGTGGFSKSTRYTLCSPELQPQTVADQATVAQSATVADPATRKVADQATSPVADQARGKEQTIEQTKEQTIVGATAPAKPKSVRATVLPDGFTPDDTARLMAADFGVDLDDQLSAFCDHHAAKGSTFKDWQAALRTWLRNARRFGQQSGASAMRPTRHIPNRQEALEARNRAVAEAWMPPEMRAEREGARNAS